MEVQKDRIIFLDLMRAFAVLMMVQGHTVDALLSNEYRSSDLIIYSIWNSFRGFTAPIFMFTAGVAFTYLLTLQQVALGQNVRVKKGIKRFFLLLSIGYLLRYPTYKLFDFSQVTDQQWSIFFAVDALHLIAFGLLFIIIAYYIGRKFNIRDGLIFSLSSAFFFLVTLFVQSIDWAGILPLPLAAYMYSATGSLFPLFPWAGYVLGGAVLGSYLAKNPAIFRSRSFSLKLLFVGIIFILLSVMVSQLESAFAGSENLFSGSLATVFYRLGVIILMNSGMAYISLNIRRVPEFIKQIGRHTLVVYTVHLIILFGCAWMPGLNYFFPKSLSLTTTLGVVLLMYAAMGFMVLSINRVKLTRKRKLAAVHT